jgi:hypothetical protein
MAWVRHGECNRCGDCCKGDLQTEDMPQRQVDGYCALFKWTADGLGCCTDRTHRIYSSGCNIWPDEPALIADKPNCSYSFTWED